MAGPPSLWARVIVLWARQDGSEEVRSRVWWTRHKAVIAVAAVVVLAGLVTGLLLALRGGGTVKPVSATPSPSPTAELRSPFTGEPVPSLNRVLAVKIDNIVN